MITVGLLLWFGMTFVIAEIIRRVCLFTEEIAHLDTRYDGSISRVVLHVFNTRNSANIFTVITLLSLLFVSCYIGIIESILKKSDATLLLD